jgi:hypothetical protein
MFELTSDITQLFLSAFIVALAAFVLGSTVLTAWTWFNTQRLRNCIQTWKDPGLHGVPIFPAIFTAVVVSVSVYNTLANTYDYRLYEFVYLWLGINWYVAYHLMSKRYITDFGIVKNINDPSQTIAWSRVNDYLELSREGYTEFTFFFASEESSGLRSHRIKLKVPNAEYETFRRILTYKVDRHLSHTWFETSDIERLY